MLLKYYFIAIFYFSFLKSLNLSQKLDSLLLHTTLNLTLEPNDNYYIDSFFDFQGDEFYLIGNENNISMTPQTTNGWILSFKECSKVFFSNIYAFYEGYDLNIGAIFFFENVETIIFENSRFYIKAENIDYFLVSSSLQINFFNCTLANSISKNFFFIHVNSVDYIKFTRFNLMNSTLTNSCFFYGKEILMTDFLNMNIEKNELVDSKLFSLQSKYQNFLIFIISNNFFKGDSYLMIFEQNAFDGNFFLMEEFNFQHNLIDKSIMIGDIESFASLSFHQITFSNNIVKEKIFYVKSYSDINQVTINFETLLISLTNDPIQDYTTEISSTKQSFVTIEGNFILEIQNCSFIENFCNVGPCGFHFNSGEIRSVANIISTAFSNNLAIYSDENDIPTCLFFLEGSIELIMKNVIMINNSVNYLNENNEIEAGEKGNPCLYSDNSETSLSIANSFFYHNSGYGDYGESFCILFKGIYLEILDSLFLGNFGPIESQIFLFVVDCPMIKLINISIIGCIGGTLLIDTQKELIQINSKNISIISNKASVYAFYYMLQKYDLRFEQMSFLYNVCYYTAALATVNSLGIYPQDQQLSFINSFFNNNTSIETAVRSVMMEIYTIGSFTNFTNCSFEDNYSKGEDDYGGIVYSYSEIYGYVTFVDCTLKNNSATFGGISYSSLGTIIFQNNYMKNNIARSSNGALFEIQTYSDFILQNCSLIENYGGFFIGLQRATFLIFQNEFINNLFLNESKTFTISMMSVGTISNCNFINQTGDSNGFFVSIFNALDELTFENNTIENCSIKQGSFMMINSAKMLLQNMIIKNIKGSLIYISSGYLILQNFFLSNQLCDESVCVANIMLNSNMKINNINIMNIRSNKYDIISIASSYFELQNAKFENIDLISDQNSHLIVIMNSDFFVSNFTGYIFNQNIVFASKSTITLNEIKLMGNTTKPFSAIISDNNIFLKITNSTFENFINEYGGAIYNEKTQFILTSSKFFNNKGLLGGAIYTYESNVSFIGNLFDENSAEYGAGIYFYSYNLILDLKLKNNTFIFGNAKYAGGGIYSVYSIPEVEGNIFLNNTAEYGNDYATPPITLFFDHNDKINVELTGYLPSSIFSNEMIVYLKDFYNNSVDFVLKGKGTLSLATVDMYDYANITDESQNNKQIFGQVLSDYSSKSFIFSQIKLNFKPKSILLLKINTDLISNFAPGSFSYTFPHYLDSFNNYHYLVEINSKECPLGSIFFEKKNLCQKCPNGEYSLSYNDSYCHKCPENSVCNTNGSFISVLPGYWRGGYFSTTILECSIPNACLGNECDEGYEGPLCDTCKYNYFKQPQVGCEKCESALSSYFVMAIMILLVILYILFTLRVNIKQLDKDNGNKDQFLNLYLRIMTDYFQVISTIIKVKVNFVYGIGDFFTKFSFISDFLGNIFSFFYPLDCFYSIFNLNGLNVFYVNLYLLLLLYPVVLLINALFWGIISYFTKTSIPWILRRFFLAVFLISYMVQPSFINAYFKYISCTKIEETLYLKNYLVEKCWEGAHLFHFLAFIFPSLIFWMVAYPLLVLYLLRLKNKGTIENSILNRGAISNNQQMFSFFTDGLKENFYYWEILLMFRKYIFIILSIFPITKTLILNLWLLCIFSFAFLFFQVQKKPFIFEKAVKISLFTNSIILIAVLGLTVLFIENTIFNQMLFLSIFAILNSILFWKWGYDIYKLKKSALVSKIQSIKNSIGKALSRRNISSLQKSTPTPLEAKVFRLSKPSPSAFSHK